MEIRKFYADERGRIVINGAVLRVRETEKYKNYKVAVNSIKVTKSILIAGVVSFFIGLFLVFGSVGHVELLSLVEEADTWEPMVYLILCSIGTFSLILGMVFINWGYPRFSTYEKWIREYLE